MPVPFGRCSPPTASGSDIYASGLKVRSRPSCGEVLILMHVVLRQNNTSKSILSHDDSFSDPFKRQ